MLADTTVRTGEATPEDVILWEPSAASLAFPRADQETTIWLWANETEALAGADSTDIVITGWPTGGVEMQLDDVLEGSVTVRHALRYLLALVAGKATGGGTASIAYRDQADLKDRIVLTVDAIGNRSAVVVDGE